MRRIGHAQGLGDHVAMRMRARLFGGQVALRDQFLHHAVILAELGQLAIAPQVGTAVAHPRHFIAVALHARGNDGGTHRQGVVAPPRGADDFFVGGADGLNQRRAAADFAHDGFARQRTGSRTAGMPAHAIGHQPPGQRSVTVVGVLVERAAHAGVGEVSEFDHGGQGRGNAGETGIIGRLQASGKACAQEIFTSLAAMTCRRPHFLV
ncbi:hypothetical protein G6F31_018372 [Rhizopus arrhizus]|nr:hypothetical protein G6F31_018372 [Rhizopus arrhizus]